VEGYFKKQKNEDGKGGFKRLLLSAAAAISSDGKAKYTKRWFVLDTQAYTISYAPE